MESPILAFTNKRKHKIQVRNRVLKIQIQKCFGQNIKYDLVIVLTRQKKKKNLWSFQKFLVTNFK